MGWMGKIFGPEEHQTMICQAFGGYGLIRSHDDVKVCPNCGGFGFTTKEEKSFD
jgi:hypothetical protein